MPDSLVGSWMLDLDGLAARWSPEVFDIFGVSAATLDPTLDWMLSRIVIEDVEMVRDNVDRWRMHEGRFVEFNARFMRTDGAIRLLEVRGWSDGAEAGHPSWALGTARDVTEPTAAESERERLSHQQSMILDAAGDGICGLDTDGRVTFCNPALMMLMRREGEEVRGLRLHELIHRGADGHELHPLSACPFDGSDQMSVSANDLEFQRADGSRIEVAYVLVSVTDHELPGSVVSFRDVTARRAASRLLQASLQEVRALSAQRGALLADLAAAEERERLRIAADLHDETIQSLDATRLDLERVGAQVADPASRAALGDAREQVRVIAERLRHLMFELMPPMAEGDLQAAVETYCEVVLAGSGMAYEVGRGPRRLATEKYLLVYRLVQEAVRNAVKHSNGTRLRVDFDFGATELVARISDDGVGMPGGLDPQPTHAGLRIIRQRAAAAGGEAVFGPGLDGRGFSVTFHLPLEWTDLQ